MSEPFMDDERDPAGRIMAGTGLSVLIFLVGFGVAVAAYLATVRYLSVHHMDYGWTMAAAVVYGTAVLVVAAIAQRVGRRVSRQPCSPAAKRYQRRLTAAGIVYVSALVAAIGVHKQLHPMGLVAYAVAAAPALPVIGMIVAIGLFMREETDEFERAVHAEGALWATGGLLALATVWGFLELFGLAPHVESWAAFPIWALLLGPGQLIARRRYR